MIFEYLIKLRDKGFTLRNVLDIGANIGSFSLRCKQEIWPFITDFHLIEPNEECKFNLLSTGFNIYINLLGENDDVITLLYLLRKY